MFWPPASAFLRVLVSYSESKIKASLKSIKTRKIRRLRSNQDQFRYFSERDVEIFRPIGSLLKNENVIKDQEE